ncbi:MAG TPA: MarR family transcriptional regulator [Dehalococcoidia bacterium]|nr:MarR family transcriptional regulator [Dehalococcoidia bacterium]
MATETRIEEEILNLLFRLGRAFTRRRHTPNGEAELSMLQLQALLFIRERENCSMSELANEFHIGLPSATALVDRLVRAGLLSRAEDPNDRRVTRVRLTNAGKERVRRLFEQEVAETRAIVDRLPGEDREALVRIMTHVLRELEA